MNSVYVIGLLVLILLICYKFKSYFDIQENLLFADNSVENSLTDNQKKAIQKIVKTHIQDFANKSPIVPGPKGDTGEQGIQGQQGPAGGNYIGKGQLKSAKYPDMTLDRMYGMGKGSKAYMGKFTFSPNQMWTLESGTGKLINHFDLRQCLKHGTGTDPNVYMGNCKNGQTNSWRYHEQDFTVRPSNNQSMCLSIGNNIKPSKLGFLIGQNKEKQKMDDDKKLLILRLDPCTQSPQLNQKWKFN